MNVQSPGTDNSYGIEIQKLSGRVSVYRGDQLLASSTNAKAMYETRLPAVIYFPLEDVAATLGPFTEFQTFCPFKGTARYRDLVLKDETLGNVVWSYDDALPESRLIEGHVAFAAETVTRSDLANNTLRPTDVANLSGPLIDWLLREAAFLPSPEAFTAALSNKMRDSGIALSRLSVMIWSLHPMIAGKNYIWNKDEEKVTTYAPSYEIYDHPSFINSPLRHVSNGLGGIRQRLADENPSASFPIVKDLRDRGATDYVAMPLPFSGGQTNVLTLTSDHPDGFTTANLGLVFECAAAVGRFYEVFMQKENAQSLLETYVGKRSGARVLGGEIRRGDGDEIDAAIMFCDMRNSTQLEEALDRDAFIAVLNHFFETVSTIVDDAGGEVLKFIGDAVLAVFPAGQDAAASCARALASARTIVDQLREGEQEATLPGCACAIGIAFGRVTYGNVGSRERLDFTVIGQAANIAARLCDYGKTRDQSIVITHDIRGDDTALIDLGATRLHNVSKPLRVLAAKV